MGGHQAGEVASSIAVKCIQNYDFDLNKNLLEEINNVITEANQQIMKVSNNNDKYEGMGTTLSLGIILDYKLYIGHIGDSRIYLFRDQNLQQLTTDHTLVNELVEQNRIEPEEAFDHPHSNILTQALGQDDNFSIETKNYNLNKGDVLLFCTDGLSDMLEVNQIEEIISNNIAEAEAEIISNRLGQKAMNNGGNDNLTIIAGFIN